MNFQNNPLLSRDRENGWEVSSLLPATLRGVICQSVERSVLELVFPDRSSDGMVRHKTMTETAMIRHGLLSKIAKT